MEMDTAECKKEIELFQSNLMDEYQISAGEPRLSSLCTFFSAHIPKLTIRNKFMLAVVVAHSLTLIMQFRL